MVLLGTGRWYVPIGCHRCIWHRLAAICDASFDWVVSPQFWRRGGNRELEMGPLSSLSGDFL